jgi:hypothetical protein
MTRYLLMFDSYNLLCNDLSDERTGLFFCIYWWPLPAEFFPGPSPLVLATIFYCLRFETSLFVASSDSQGHGGGIRPHLHTGLHSKLFFASRYIDSGRTSRNTRHVSECVFIGPILSAVHGADHIENTSSSTFSVVCVFFGRCLEMGLSTCHSINISTKLDKDGKNWEHKVSTALSLWALEQDSATERAVWNL